MLDFLKADGMHVPPEALDTYRILIVEDEESVRDALGRALRDSGIPCEIETAEDGVVGCMKIPTFRPHLIVLDAILPERAQDWLLLPCERYLLRHCNTIRTSPVGSRS